MSEYDVLCFKPTPRLERRREDSQNGAEQFHHAALTLGDSSNETKRMRFSVYTCDWRIDPMTIF
jgi:hypothetical protein